MEGNNTPAGVKYWERICTLTRTDKSSMEAAKADYFSIKFSYSNQHNTPPFQNCTNGMFWGERACALLDYMQWILHFPCLPLEKWKTKHTLGVVWGVFNFIPSLEIIKIYVIRIEVPSLIYSRPELLLRRTTNNRNTFETILSMVASLFRFSKTSLLFCPQAS